MISWIKVFFSRRMFSVFLLGIYSGLPLLLIGSTLKAWMKEAHVDLTLIGIYALTGVPYTLKFLWAPFMDRYVPPILGRRRGWIVICQIFLAIGFVAMGFVRPDIDTWTLAGLAFLIAFFSASQDIVIDAYRREVLADAELGLGSSLAVNGYRVGMLVAGALALALADHISWSWVYVAMGGIMLSGIVVTLFSPEPSARVLPPRNLSEAVVQPFLEYFRRPSSFDEIVRAGDPSPSRRRTSSWRGVRRGGRPRSWSGCSSAATATGASRMRCRNRLEPFPLFTETVSTAMRRGSSGPWMFIASVCTGQPSRARRAREHCLWHMSAPESWRPASTTQHGCPTASADEIPVNSSAP